MLWLTLIIFNLDKKSFANHYYKAPMISLISSSRMEMAGNFVQLYCNAVGHPKPDISWQIIDNEDENLVYSIENYPFIWVSFVYIEKKRSISLLYPKAFLF